MTRSLLDDLDGLDRRDLIAAARRRRFTRNEVVFHEGDPGDSLHLIVKGYVAVRATTRLGDVVTLAVLGPGQPFGELALLTGDAERTASVVALDAVETLSWRRPQIEELRASSPDVDRFLIEILTEQVQRLSGLLVEALHLPVETRLVKRLAALVELYDPEADEVILPVTQEDLASLAGTTRPTANRVLKGLEASGLIQLARGRTVVVDCDGLLDAAARG